MASDDSLPFAPDIFSKEDTLKKTYEECEPYPLARIQNLFDASFLEQVKENLMGVKFFPKDNDLYHFYQSDDLKNEDSPVLQKLRNSLYSEEFRGFLQRITGLELSDRPDLSGSLYLKGHTLLCHDDQVEDRALAFILYLVDPEWVAADGGSLDIFTGANGLAKTRVRSLVPQWNSFVFFEVSPKSFHQVSEILSDSRKRLTVGGWFHGKPLNIPTPAKDPDRVFSKPLHSSNETVKKWLADTYQQDKTIEKLNAIFCEQGMIELKNILRPELYLKLREEINSLKWKHQGPLNRRKYGILNRSECTPLYRSLNAFLSSEEWRAWLANLTSISITKCSTEIRRFGASDYSMMHDLDRRAAKPGLDACFSLSSAEHWDPAWGGYRVYQDEDSEENEVCTSELEGNKLTVVWRNGLGFHSFVKYLNADAGENCRIDFDQTWDYKDSQKDGVPEVDPSQGATLADLMGK